MDVVRYRPEPAEFAWTFGGAAPVMKVKPGDVLELWTEDAFGGKVRGPDDVISRVIQFPFVNPQTGPFHVEGAEPGDTLAIHFVSIEPSRDWGASCLVPLFGALSSTHQTASLHEPLPEVVWIYEVDRAARTVTYRARHGDQVARLPLDPMHGTVGVAPANLETRLSLAYQGVVEGRLSLERWLDVAAATPARLFGLGDRKGALEPGMDADIVVFDPGATRRLEASSLHMRTDHSPYASMALTGWPAVTISGGTVVARDGEPAEDLEPGRGRYLHRAPRRP
jgi:hypothetical protein